MKKRVLFIIFILSVIILCITAIQIYIFGWHSKPQKADCIIILGCSVYGDVPSPFLAGRIDEGVRLYKENFSKTIIVSGGIGPGENISEAQAMKEYAVSHGVNIEDVIMEDKSTSTSQNIGLSIQKMKDKSFKSAIIVSNKYHLKRISIIAKKYNVKTYYSGVFMNNYKNREIYGFLREIAGVIIYSIKN